MTLPQVTFDAWTVRVNICVYVGDLLPAFVLVLKGKPVKDVMLRHLSHRSHRRDAWSMSRRRSGRNYA